MNSKLQDAVAIFKALGWEQATPKTIMSLPIGTAEQKRTALAGLKSGEFGSFGSIGKNTYGWISGVDVNEGMLALFAVRIGVNAQRAANILNGGGSKVIAEVIASRGAKYAADFIDFACVSRRRVWEHSASAFGAVAVLLVDKLDLDVPQNVQYMKDWSAYAAAALGLKAEILGRETDLPETALIEKRFIEHIKVGVAVGAPATGPFGTVLPEGVKRGWLPQEEAIELVFLALDAAVRPADRKVWLEVLDKLDVSNAVFLARSESLIPLLTSGDSFVITRLAPTLIASVDDRLAVEALSVAFSATTKKAKQLVLRSALDRSRPNGAEDLTIWLSILSDDKDKSVASLATKLMDLWEIHPEALPEEPPTIQGLWQETPPLWQAPAFDPGEISPEALTELAAVLYGRPEVHDIATERFLAVANAVACENPDAARTSLRGLRVGDVDLLDYVVCWVKKETPRYGADNENRIHPPLDARDYIVCLHLGKLPCILSIPSRVDLSISIPDLASRLALYQKTDAATLEADLLLAITRLDPNTTTPEALNELCTIKVPVVLQSGKKLPVTAGQAVLDYLEHPIEEPVLDLDQSSYWRTVHVTLPESLRHFPDRLAYPYHNEHFSIFPLWGDVALRAVCWDSEVYHEQGLVLRQVARRAEPLPPATTMNFLAAQRSMPSDAAEDSALAVTEAWERGLLRPDVADARLLDWSSRPPAHLAALVMALETIARDNMLSVVWPVLDALIVSSLDAPRLLTGTAELAELVLTFLPEVQFAVKQGLAEPATLELPGIRALAGRGGSSRAVEAARKVAELLPPAQAESPKVEYAPLNPPFDEIWQSGKKATVLIEDGVTVTVDEAPQVYVGQKLFLFTLTLPDIHDRVFQVVKGGWYYDLECEGQCQAYTAATAAIVAFGDKAFKEQKENQVWLHWDAEQKRMLISDFRNWREGKDGSLKGGAAPLTSSLLMIIVSLLAQDGHAVYFAQSMLKKSIENEDIDSQVIRKVTRCLLGFPVVSPAKLVRVLEKDLQLLPVLWPMLTECVKSAGNIVGLGNNPPVWVNRILDIALRYAPYLAEAAKRGLIPPEDAKWPGLADIAAAKAKSAAVAKAKKLLAQIE